MAKEDKDKILQLAYELSEEERTFTDEEIIQLTDWKMESERLAGIAEGHAAGIAEGHASGLTETARNMLESNYSIEEIEKITGLTKEEIIKIRESI